MSSRSKVVVASIATLAGLSCSKPAPPQPASEAEVKTRSAELPVDRSADVAADTKGSAKMSHPKKGFVQNIETLTEDNRAFRRVLYTGEHSQLVVMALPPGDHIGAEVHDVDQFFRVEEGIGEVVIGQTKRPIGAGSAVIVPAGAKHDIINTGSKPLQLYTIYSPPHHRDGVVHRTRAEAEKDDEHFDGKTSE